MNKSKSISFQGINSTVTSGKITWEIGISDLLKGIVSGEYINGESIKDIRDIIGNIRKEGKKIQPDGKKSKEYIEFKKKLPGICIQGIFKPDKKEPEKYPKGRRKKDFLSVFTNVIGIDIDNVPIKDLFKLKGWIIEQLGKYSFVIANSPGGKGFHIYLYADVNSEAEISRVLENVQREIGVKVDPQTKDCTRFFNCTWDPDAFINETPEIYNITPLEPGGQDLVKKVPGSGFFDIESLLIEKGFLGKVCLTDNIIWKAFTLLAKHFDKEYVEKYLADKKKRGKLFKPGSNNVNELKKIQGTLDNAYKEVEKWSDGFDKYFRTGSGIFKETLSDLGEINLQGVNQQLFFSEYGKDSIFKIRKYDGFGNIPNNYPNIKEVDFKPVPGHIYNLYHYLRNKPVAGSWDSVKMIFEHIFTDQVQYIYDYVRLLLVKPSQILPILVLISGERETGKTTFLNLIREIFNPNSTIIPMIDFSSRFNSHYANKLIVALDESKLDKKELEKIKSLSTSLQTSCEFKGKDVSQIRNLQHFILASNSLDFAYVDKQENRFWTFQIGKIKKTNPGLYKKAIDEIPAFIHYLIYNHKMIVPEPLTRAWFPADIVTKDFQGNLYEQVKQTFLHQLKDKCQTWFVKNEDEKELRFSLQDFHDFYKVHLSSTVLREILLNEDWINKYSGSNRLQYHVDFFEEIFSPKNYNATLSDRGDRRKGLFYVKRDDIIDYEIEDENQF